MLVLTLPKNQQKHAYTLVGFEKRGISERHGSYKYVRRPKGYSIILPSCAFVHREFLRMFNESLPVGMRKLIRSLKNCEDIALNMLMSHHCQCAASLYVKPKQRVYDIGPQIRGFSLHNRPSHYKDRSKCLNHFQLFFPKLPLQTVSSKCTDMTRQ